VIACHAKDRWHLILESVGSAFPGIKGRIRWLLRWITYPIYAEGFVTTALKYGSSRMSLHGVPPAFETQEVSETDTPIIAFLDDAVRARPGRPSRLLPPLADPAVVGTGGFVRCRRPVERALELQGAPNPRYRHPQFKPGVPRIGFCHGGIA
jgi:hypothetical protein